MHLGTFLRSAASALFSEIGIHNDPALAPRDSSFERWGAYDPDFFRACRKARLLVSGTRGQACGRGAAALVATSATSPSPSLPYRIAGMDDGGDSRAGPGDGVVDRRRLVRSPCHKVDCPRPSGEGEGPSQLGSDLRIPRPG